MIICVAYLHLYRYKINYITIIHYVNNTMQYFAIYIKQISLINTIAYKTILQIEKYIPKSQKSLQIKLNIKSCFYSQYNDNLYAIKT